MSATVVLAAPKELFDLPDSMIEQIFEFLGYDEVAKKRVVRFSFFSNSQFYL